MINFGSQATWKGLIDRKTCSILLRYYKIEYNNVYFKVFRKISARNIDAELEEKIVSKKSHNLLISDSYILQG